MSAYEGSSNRGIVEVRFETNDPSYPFVGVSEAEKCRVEMVTMLPREGGRYAEYFCIREADPERVMELVATHEGVHPRNLDRHANGGLFEFVVSDGCPVRRLATLGAVPRRVLGENGSGEVIVEIPPGYSVSELVGEFLDEYSSVSLSAKSEKDPPTPLFSGRQLRRAIESELTARQREALRTAFEAGYYERPRAATGKEVADELGISPATFFQHVRAAERHLVSILYEDGAL